MEYIWLGIYILGYILCFISFMEAERNNGDILVIDIFRYIVHASLSWIGCIILLFELLFESGFVHRVVIHSKGYKRAGSKPKTKKTKKRQGIPEVLLP